MANTLWALESMAFALYQSLYEERFLDEGEFIKDQKELKEDLKEIAKKNRKKLYKSGSKNLVPPSETPLPPLSVSVKN